MADVNNITVIVIGVVVGVVGLLISTSMITAGNFTGTVAALMGLVPIVLSAVILFIGVRGLLF